MWSFGGNFKETLNMLLVNYYLYTMIFPELWNEVLQNSYVDV